ncbi:MAG TPA: hypothetical protein VKR24_05125 [Candidatus Limnocylindrales bacterium]|nr:hypothetical protein [Candidatus Limnocylindrales bacterium]
MPYQRLARHVLEEWRLLERRLAEVDPRSPEEEQLIAEAHALRDEYQHLIEEAEAHHRPTPPPFPEDALQLIEPPAPTDELGDGPDLPLGGPTSGR